VGRERTRRLRSWFERLDLRAMRRAGEITRRALGVGSLDVEWVPARFGGARAFWRCPVCGRPCEVLYRAPGPGAPYGTACRTCQRVSYETTAMRRADRLFARRDAILARLGIRGATPNLPAAYGLKPRGMHWRTFLREIESARRLEAEALGAGLAALRGEPAA
jgi:hypothetical protein